jgi:hypothetical protein
LNSIVLRRFFKQVPEFSSGGGPVWIRDIKLMSLSMVVNGYIALHNLDLLQKKAPAEARAPKYRDALNNFLMTPPTPSKKECIESDGPKEVLTTLASREEKVRKKFDALKKFLATPTSPLDNERKKFVEAYRAFRKCADEIAVELGETMLVKYWKSNKLDFITAEDPEESVDPTAQPKIEPAKSGARGVPFPLDVEKAIVRQSGSADRLEFVLLRHAAHAAESPTEHPLALAAAAGSSRPQSASADRGNSVSTSFWAMECSELAAPGETDDQPQASGPSKEEYELASLYVALHYSTYIGYILHQLQNLLVGSSVCFALLMLALNSFAFQAPQTLFHLASATFLIGGIFVLKALAQMERDPILSRLSGSKEGELGKDFYIRVLTFGTLPILTVLATEFPSIGQYISSLVKPMSAVLH